MSDEQPAKPGTSAWRRIGSIVALIAVIAIFALVTFIMWLPAIVSRPPK